MKCKRQYFLSVLILNAFMSSALISQNLYEIKGEIKTIDGEIIPGAQIFINGSTIGTVSDKNGVFNLTGIPYGVYELVAQSLGFESQIIKIQTGQLSDFYTITLKEKVYDLDEITVKPNREDWKINFEQFRNTFIGRGPFSDRTKILNEEVLNFDYDPITNKLTAYAYEHLDIENKDLGYRIFFYLDYFEIDYKNRTNFFAGQTFFEPLSSRRKKTRNKWNRNRETAYNGSFLHFTKSLIEGNANQEGFLVYGEKRENRERYVSKDTVSNSLYFHKVDSTTYKYEFVNFLNVTYQNEYEDMSYLRSKISPLSSNQRLLPAPQNSSFTLLTDYALVDISGVLYNPRAILFDGYWGFEKLSDMLPINYLAKSEN